MRFFFCFLLCLTGLVACDDGGTTAGPAACTVGAADCPCAADDTCDDGLFCAGGVCRAPSCELGEAGCLCFDDDTCRVGPDGRPLACVEGRCQISECPVGGDGCACGAFDRCDAGLICQNGTCGQPGCTPGDLDCICDGDSCTAGLVCDAGRCVDPGCTLGNEGCFCVDGACNGDLICQDGRCASACPAGNLGCACDAGLCDSGFCVDDVCTDCTAGEIGCVCGANSRCAEGATCANGLCVPDACPPGSADCACDAGRCDAELACQDGSCRACPAGETGCACLPGDACADPAADRCADGACQPLACAVGTEGCVCTVDGGCGVTAEGDALACTDGVCTAERCTPGADGCACVFGADCADAGSACTDGVCQPRGCAPGTLDCACANGRCDGDLSCRGGVVCVDAEGTPGARCFEDGGCVAGAVCDANWTCQACQPGSAGCSCDAGTCQGALACEADRCVPSNLPPEARLRPANPVCYTPCRADLVNADGGFRRCPADGLMPGCIDGRVCDGSTCVPDGGAPDGCAADTECEEWQICIQGECHSNCTRDADCSAGYSCHQKVCRADCLAEADAPCGPDMYCDLTEGDAGVCLPLQPASDGEQLAQVATLAIDRPGLRFTNVRTDGQFVITNDGPIAQTVTISKRSHQLSTANGQGERENDPAGALFWLSLGEFGADGARVQSLDVEIPAGEFARIVVTGADQVDAPRWQGVIEVSAPGLNTERFVVEYDVRPEGRWRGEIHYFGVFGDAGLEGWANRPNPAPGTSPANGGWAGTKDDPDALLQVGNALVQRWGAFRRQRLSFDEFEAVLQSVISGSWRWPSVREACPANTVCYPYTINRDGIREMTTRPQTVPVPYGVVEMPFAMTLRSTGDNALSGAIDSRVAMQYAGFPAIDLTFSSDPATCHRDAQGTCLSFVEGLDAQIVVGGRYTDAGCLDDFEPTEQPWLVPGFERATLLDDAGAPVRVGCADTRVGLAAANPIPDGRARRRTMRVIDGALINQTTLFVIFEERFESFFDPDTDTEGFGAYGVMLLTREPMEVDETDEDQNGIADAYEGARPDVPAVGEPVDALAVSCDPALVQAAIGEDRLTAGNAGRLAETLIDGVIPSRDVSLLDADTVEQPHYLCVDLGIFDGGADNDTPHGLAGLNDDSCGRVNGTCEDGGDANAFVELVADDDQRVRCALGTDATDCGPRFADDVDVRAGCPEGSEIVYFTVDSAEMSQADIAALPCQQDGSCAEVLDRWIESGAVVLQAPARWRCADPDAVYCTADRGNLREGKEFFALDEERAVFEPLQPAIEQAFRYKIRFRNRTGRNVGFAPERCDPNSAIPYCYDPAAIETLRTRIDCLLAIDAQGGLSNALQQRLTGLLRDTFSQRIERRATGSITHDGFERLYTELLVMLGDESLTRSFASRFDLAAQNATAFPGSALEAGGFDLSGQTGFEMYRLYQAQQYYQEALDRFYALSPSVWATLNGAEGTNFVTQATVTSWFERLTRASTQKARVASEIARRWAGFNQPALARRVIERAYTASYLESVVMSRLMLKVVDELPGEAELQVEQIMTETQGRFRIAMLEMRDVYDSITDDRTFLGIAPDFVPLPALDSADFRQSNAFEALLRRAQQKVDFARDREERALASNREFDSDGARFQAELVDIRNTYENQLVDICGVFEGDDGVIRPAIARYGDQSPETRVMADPCGATGSGRLHEAIGQLEIEHVELQQVVAQMEVVIESVEIERQRVSQQCGLVFELADFTWEQQGRINNMQRTIDLTRFGMERADRALGHFSTALNLGIGGGIAFGIAAGIAEAGIGFAELKALDKERDIASLERDTARWETQQRCEVLVVDGNARMAELLLQLNELELEQLRGEIEINRAYAQVSGLRNQARRVEQQQQVAEQLAIDAEAARNDPNIRIYRNDAVINADLAFEDAMRAAYRATLVYEYYTSQTFAEKDRLFFIRLVSRGEDNLENYLADLFTAFEAFEQEFGLPDTRVMVISLKDDILAVPYVDAAGNGLSSAERTARMHAALADPKWLDANGFIALPFHTRLEALSPITHNHKVQGIEVAVTGADFGDHVARLYLEQSGTGVLRGSDGSLDFYRLPSRVAVLNPFFNGSKPFDNAIYRNSHLRDRPLVNTAWTLYINQRSEAVNQDVNLQALTDIRLYVYYSDFTDAL